MDILLELPYLGQVISYDKTREFILFKKIKEKKQRLTLFEINKSNEIFSIDFPDNNLVQCSFVNSELLVWHNSITYTYNIIDGVLKNTIRGVYTITGNWLIQTPIKIKEDLYLFKLFEHTNNRFKYNISSGKWSRFFYSTKTILAYTKTKNNNQKILLYQKNTDYDNNAFPISEITVSSLFPSISSEINTRLIKVISGNNCFYLYFSNGYLVNISQHNGKVNWISNIGHDHNIRFYNGNLIVLFAWGKKVINIKSGLIGLEHPFFPNKIKKNYQSSKIIKTQFENNNYYIHGFINHDHSAVVLSNNGKIEIINAEFINEISSLTVKGISNFFIINNKILINDFSDNSIVLLLPNVAPDVRSA